MSWLRWEKLNKELSVFLHNLFENARHEMAEANDKALTVEELRGMDGEPVWVVYPEAESPNEWGILKGKTCIIATGYFLEFMSYGVQWLAYRRPPEKGEHNEV